MTLIRPLHLSRYLLVSLIAPIVLACSGAIDPGGCEDCGTGEVEVASATVNPKSGTIARGGSMNATVTYSASSNLKITGYHVQGFPAAISVNQASTQGSGNNVVRSYTILAGPTAPLGTHVITFWISVDGATNTVQTTRAEFSVTVTQ